MVLTIIAFIIVFSILVVIHELGHFYVAKKSGILVREFAIGMGPKLLSVQKNHTTFTVRLLPLGGYVRMAGLEDDDDNLQKGQLIFCQMNEQQKIVKIDTRSDADGAQGLPLQVVAWDLVDELTITGIVPGKADEAKQTFAVCHDAQIVEKDGTTLQIAPRDVQYQAASLPKRILTNLAGPFNNIVLAIVAFMLVAVMQGGVAQYSTTLGSVEKNSPAQTAKLAAGDTIVAINGVKMTSWDAISTAIANNGTKKMTVTYKTKTNQQKTTTITPKNNGGQSYIGVVTKVSYDRSPQAIIGYGFTAAWALTVRITTVLKQMILGHFSLNNLGGPVAMYAVTSQATHYGMVAVISLLAMLSLNLAIFNLIPIPGLDGGKLLLNIIEAIRKKPLDPDKEVIVTLIGAGFLILLMILVTGNDIYRFFIK